MKNFLLLILFCLSHLINAQVVFKGVSPSSISGISFDFEWAEPTGTWSTTIPDFNQQNTYIQDTLELVVDNSWTGNNPAYTIPHPLANEGCLDANGGAHSQPSLAGKIAVVWRGSCSFGLKAALAENNGAVAIVIINHSGAPVGMAGGDSGLFINIPVVMISTTDGQLLLSEMANGPVEVFIGNKIGSSVNDLGSSKDVSNISKYGSVPTSFVQNGNNNFDLGLTITNYGSDDNIPVLNQTITGPSGYSYDTTVTYGLLPAAQDTDYTYIPYTETNLAIGNYTLNYNLSILNETDQDSSDNNIISSFSVTNDVLSRARTDQSTGEIIANFYPSNYTQTMSSCMHLYEENYPVSSIAEGVYFSVATDSTPLSSEYFNVSIYEWNDIQSGGWADYTVNQLTPVLINDYFFANDSLSEKIVYHEFDDGNGQPAPFQFLDFQRYLVCIEYQGGTALDISFGYDNYLDYQSNSVYNPDFGSGRLNIDGFSPFNGAQGTWYTGWSGADAPSIGLKFGDSTVPPSPPTGQCVPDNSYLGNPFGIYSTVNDTFYLNVPSSKSYTITTSTDAGFYDPNYSGYVIDSIKLVSVTNLPAGLNYSTNNNYLSLGGVDCININGVYNNSINSSDSVEFKFVGCVSLFGIAICDTFTTSKLFHFYDGQNPPSPPPAGQTRYLDPVFNSSVATNNIVYAVNQSVLLGESVPIATGATVPIGLDTTTTPPTPILFSMPALEMDIFQPSGDTVSERPLIIYLHTGEFAPIIRNGNATGSRTFDYATQTFCNEYAKRGYVVANTEYRLGWNPTLPTQPERASSFLKAVYRGVQDAKAAVRFLREDYENGNTYRIDTSKIIIVGEGTGGHIALAYATIDKLSELQLPKFLDVVTAVPLLDTAVLGDWDGYGGNPAYNTPSNIGYSNKVHMVCNMGGMLMDLSWLEAGDVPIAAVHGNLDAFARFTTGNISVSGVNIISNISGSHDVVKKANIIGNNVSINNTNDIYTIAAQNASNNLIGTQDFSGVVINNAPENLFPFVTGNPGEGAPWEFWDLNTLILLSQASGLSASQGNAANASSLQTNPDMSLSKANAYIDSTLGFFTHKIYNTLITNCNTVSYGIDSLVSCDSYTWIDGNTYTSSNNTATYTIQNTAGCDSIVTLDLTLNYSSTNSISNLYCGSYLYNGQTYFSPNIFHNTLTNASGCDSNLTISFEEIVSYGIDTIVSCSSYTWIDGNTYFSSNSSASYTVQNAAGCDSIVTLNLTINSNQFNADFTVNQTLFTAPPFAAQFTNTTPNPSNYNFTWDFSDGTILQSNNPSVFHQFLNNGLYDVTLIAENILTGCTDTMFKDDFIFCAGGTSCTHASTINQTGPITACLSDSIFLTCNTDPTFSYQWRLNGTYIPGAIDTIYYPTQSGNYSVLISQNGCPEVSSDISVTVSPTPNPPFITSSGSFVPCQSSSVTLSVPNNFATYSWSSGGTSSSEVITSSGSYFVTVTNIGGCTSTSLPFNVNASFVQPPDVCIVGVNSQANFNRVVWEHPNSTAIDSFYVYKETNQANIYQKIGGTAYNDTAVFDDVSSNPAVQAYRYKLSSVDSCGVESDLGDFHKTIHLTINQGIGSAWNLIWSGYEGFTYPSYNIYRGISSSNMVLLTTIASNLNSYTDLTAPGGQLYYQIEVVSNYTCDPSRSFNSSRSNIVENGQSPSSIINKEINTVKVFPNPTNENITISIENFNGNIQTEVYDLIGHRLQNTNKTTINLRDYARGIYLLKVAYGDRVEEVKVIKE